MFSKKHREWNWGVWTRALLKTERQLGADSSSCALRHNVETSAKFTSNVADCGPWYVPKTD